MFGTILVISVCIKVGTIAHGSKTYTTNATFSLSSGLEKCKGGVGTYGSKGPNANLGATFSFSRIHRPKMPDKGLSRRLRAQERLRAVGTTCKA